MKGAEHLVALSLGGAPEDMRNVWPEPKAEARRKCAGFGATGFGRIGTLHFMP